MMLSIQPSALFVRRSAATRFSSFAITAGVAATPRCIWKTQLNTSSADRSKPTLHTVRGSPVSIAAVASDEVETGLSDEYSKEMQEKMGGTHEYRHEDGMNFAHVLDDLIVGSCLQTPADLDRLVDEEGVGTIMCLQQDSDMEYFKLDIQPILNRIKERGDVQHVRHYVRDFDPFSLRINLPDAVRKVHTAFQDGRGKVYIHCTAGMGRAPALALAYMWWCRGLELHEAFEKLYSVRKCCPKLAAIREATCDVLYGADPSPASISVSHQPPTAVVEAAGLDIGWGQRAALKWDPRQKHHRLDLQLLPGRYPFKLIFDGRWSYDADLPSFYDGENINNYVDVPRESAVFAACTRIMDPEGQLTSSEADLMKQIML